MTKVLSISGMPYGPDVIKLDEAFARPEEGQKILSRQFENILGIPQKTQRFYGVINSWRRKLLNDRNIDTQWIQGEGLKILAPSDRLPVTERDMRIANRRTKRAIRRHVIIPRDRLDEIGKQRYDHNSGVYAKLKAAVDDARKELPIDLAPVKSLPKPRLVKTS